MGDDKQILARTWNQNQAGTLWERLWYKDQEGYASQVMASGVFVGPTRYPDEESFWAKFKADVAEFNGKRV